MESHQNKSRIGGMEGVESRSLKEGDIVENKTGLRNTDLILRVLAFVLTLVAAIVLGVDRQTTVVPVPFSPNLPPLNVPVSAKWHYLSAFVYFVVTNAIACSSAAISILLSLANRSRNKPSLITVILDIVVTGLLFSGIGAATGVGLIGYQGNSHVRWEKVCNVFDKFCNQVAASIVLSLVGAILYLLLIVISAIRLQKKSK